MDARSRATPAPTHTDAKKATTIDALDVVPSAANLHIAAMFHDARRDADAIVARVYERGVGVQSLREFYAAQPRPGLALGFGLIATNQIAEGVARLAKVLGATASTRATRRISTRRRD